MRNPIAESPLTNVLMKRGLSMKSTLPQMTPSMPAMGKMGGQVNQPKIKPLATKLHAPKR